MDSNKRQPISKVNQLRLKTNTRVSYLFCMPSRAKLIPKHGSGSSGGTSSEGKSTDHVPSRSPNKQPTHALICALDAPYHTNRGFLVLGHIVDRNRPNLQNKPQHQHIQDAGRRAFKSLALSGRRLESE